MEKQKTNVCKRFFFPSTMEDKNTSHKIAYIALFTAFSVVANMFFEFKMADTQFSLTIAVSILIGVMIGPLFGFCACFLGDLLGFLYNSGGFAYLPWIGISMGLCAFIGGIVMRIPVKRKYFWTLKLFAVCLLTFCLCTVAINTTAFWLLYSKAPYTTYLFSRMIVQGQIWNSLFNYAVLFICLPILAQIKVLKINL